MSNQNSMSKESLSAQRPYMLRGEEREAIEDMLRIMTKSYDKWCADGYPEPKSRRIAALTAALALQEPFTLEELGIFDDWLKLGIEDASIILPHKKTKALRTKLRAYIKELKQREQIYSTP